jgi:hypothetical protein
MKIMYRDGSQEEIEANFWELDETNSIIRLIKREYDEDENYDEDEDNEIALINLSEFRKIVL